jgi:hypothetical protein
VPDQTAKYKAEDIEEGYRESDEDVSFEIYS